jgi:hypothetical protein
MSLPSIVAVYGVPHGDRRPSRLGSGSLEHERIVVLDQELSDLLASNHPPELLRVGIAGRVDGEPYVEVVEIRQTLRGQAGAQWAVELWTAATSPTIWDVRSQDASFPVGPANGICFLFPSASFC